MGNGCWIRPPSDTLLLRNVGHSSLPSGLVVLLCLLPVVPDTPTQIPTGIRPRFLQNHGFLHLLFRTWSHTKRSRSPCLYRLCCAFKHRQCLHFHPSFVEIVKSQANCSTDLNVATVTGFVLETVAVTYDIWVDQQTLSRYLLLDLALKILNCAIIVCLGLHLTGMYLHPAMATGHTFGCGPTPILSHILVYWGGPFIGIYIGLKLGQMFHLPTSTTTNSQQPIKTTQNGDHGDSIVKQTEQNGHHSGEVRNRSRKKKHY